MPRKKKVAEEVTEEIKEAVTETKKAPAKKAATKKTAKKPAEKKETEKKPTAKKTTTKKTAKKAEEKKPAEKADAAKPAKKTATKKKSAPKKKVEKTVEPLEEVSAVEVVTEEEVLPVSEPAEEVKEEMKPLAELIRESEEEERVEEETKEAYDTVQETVREEKPKKKFSIAKFLLTIILVIAIFLAGTFVLYKTTVDVSARHEEEFDYVVDEDNDNSYNILSFLHYNSMESDLIGIDIPKGYIYDELVDIKSLCAQVKVKYDVSINRIGFYSDNEHPNIINVHADVTYKGLVSAYVTGQIEYVFTEDNGIDIVYRGAKVGDGFPEFIYKSFIPFSVGDVIYSLKAEQYDLLKEGILKFNTIRDIVVDDDSVSFNFDLISNIKTIAEYFFPDIAAQYEDYLDSFLPIILDILIGENRESYLDMAKELLPLLWESFLEDPSAFFN